MTGNESEIFNHAVKLLAGQDYSVAKLREKLEARHGEIPESVIQQLIAKKFLNDRRFAENFVARRKNRGVAQLREELLSKGIDREIVDEILSRAEWPSLRDALTAKMVDWKLR